MKTIEVPEEFYTDILYFVLLILIFGTLGSIAIGQVFTKSYIFQYLLALLLYTILYSFLSLKISLSNNAIWNSLFPIPIMLCFLTFKIPVLLCFSLSIDPGVNVKDLVLTILAINSCYIFLTIKKWNEQISNKTINFNNGTINSKTQNKFGTFDKFVFFIIALCSTFAFCFYTQSYYRSDLLKLFFGGIALSFGLPFLFYILITVVFQSVTILLWQLKTGKTMKLK